MGAQDALYVTKMCLDRYSSRTVVLIGIAGSLDDEVLVTDVVVADSVDDYLQDSALKDEQFKPGGRGYRPHIRLNNFIVNLRYTHRLDWEELSEKSRTDIESAVKGAELGEELRNIVRTTGFECSSGHIASGPMVGASKEFAEWLKTNIDRKYKALEMETAGVMNAVYQGAGDERVLVVRAISDVSDRRKEKLDQLGKGALRATAMRNAIRLVQCLFRIGAFEHVETLTGSWWIYGLVGAMQKATLYSVGYFNLHEISGHNGVVENGKVFRFNRDAGQIGAARGEWHSRPFVIGPELLDISYTMDRRNILRRTKRDGPAEYKSVMELRRDTTQPLVGEERWMGAFHDLQERRQVSGVILAEKLSHQIEGPEGAFQMVQENGSRLIDALLKGFVSP
jgi:nucleoside phosphorylase